MSVGNSTVLTNKFQCSSNITSFGTFTVAGWFYIAALPPSGSSTPLGHGVDGTHYSHIRISTAGAISVTTNGGTTSTGVSVAANDWVYIGIIQNSTSGTIYLSKNNAASTVTSYTADSSASAVTTQVLNESATNYCAIYVDHLRVWNSVLTQANLDSEKNLDVTGITSNNLRDSKLHTTADMVGWTVAGGLTNGADDPYITSTFVAPGNTKLLVQKRRFSSDGATMLLDSREWW